MRDDTTDVHAAGGRGAPSVPLMPPSTDEAACSLSPRLLGLVVVVSVVMLAWMGRALLTGEIPFTGDLLHFHYPLRDFYARAMANGQAVEWMPSLFSGFFVVGEGQLGAYHPVHWLIYRALPLDRAFAVELVIAYPALWVGAWLWLRGRVGPAPAALGAFLITFSGFTMVHGVHPNMVGVLAHVPWLFLALDLADRVRSPLATSCAVSAFGLLTGSQWLLGHPQSVWFSGLMTLSYVLHSTARQPAAARVRMVTVLAGGLLVGSAIGAVQIWPTLDALRHSTRPAHDLAFATAFSLEPSRLWLVLHPYLLWGRAWRWNEAPGAGDEYGVYAGGVGLVLAAWWMARSWPASPEASDARRLGRGFALFGLIGLWLATGAHGGLYYLQTALPVVNQFRAPVRYTLFTQWALAVLVAVATARLLASTPDDAAPSRRLDVRSLWAPWGLTLLAAGSAAWLSGGVEWSAPRATVVAAGPLVMGLASALLTLAVRGRRVAVVLLAALALADHAFYSLGGIVGWQDFLTRQQAVGYLDSNGFLQQGGEVRLLRGGFPNLYLLSGHRLVDGYVGIAPARRLSYTSANALRVAQVEYAHTDALAGQRVPGAEPLERGWQRLPPPLARVRLVAQAVSSERPATDIDRIDVQRAALVGHEVELGGGPAGSARARLDEPGRIEVETFAGTRQMLVVSESFDDGWVATLDGRATHVERANGDFIGVVVPAGLHTVTLRFQPAFLATATRLSRGATLAAVGLLVVGLWRGRAAQTGVDVAVPRERAGS